MGLINGLAKEFATGLKYNPTLGLDERGVRASEEIATTLKKNRDQMLSDRYSPSSTAVVPYSPPPPAPVNVDLSGIGYEVSREITPALHNLIDGQRDLARTVSDVGYFGQQALQENQLQTRELRTLNQEAEFAWNQRNTLLQQLGDSHEVQKAIRQHLAIANVQLHGIDESIGAMHSDIVEGLGEISLDIQNMTDEMVTFKLQLFHKLDDMQALALWMHREKMIQLQSISHALRNPRQTRAFETWSIGEKARRANDPKTAIRMYEESLTENPGESRNHTSLGLMSLEASESDVAKDFFHTGAKYAQAGGENSLSAVNLLQLAKIEGFERHLPAALSLLKQAHSLDQKNLNIWVEIARVSAELGNTNTAREFVKAICLLAQHKKKRICHIAATHITLMLTDPFLAPIVQEFIK